MMCLLQRIHDEVADLCSIATIAFIAAIASIESIGSIVAIGLKPIKKENPDEKRKS